MDYYMTVGDGGSFNVDKDGALHSQEALSEDADHNHPIFDRMIDELWGGGPWLLVAFLGSFFLLGATIGWNANTWSAPTSEEYEMRLLQPDPPLGLPHRPLPDERHTLPDPSRPKMLQA